MQHKQVGAICMYTTICICMCTAGAKRSHNDVVEPHALYGDVVQQSRILYITKGETSVRRLDLE